MLSSISHAPSLIGMQAVSFRGSPERPTIALSDECDGGDEHMPATVLIADGAACLNTRYSDPHGVATVEGPHERCRGLLEVGVPPWLPQPCALFVAKHCRLHTSIIGALSVGIRRSTCHSAADAFVAIHRCGRCRHATVWRTWSRSTSASRARKILSCARFGTIPHRSNCAANRTPPALPAALGCDTRVAVARCST